MPTLAALLVAAAQNEQTVEQVEPLAARSIFVTLAVIVVAGAAVLLAGFGYFTSSDDG